jgi:uncharacterized protein (DUF983 family)
MQHPQGPSVGPEFDPDFEAPSDEDIARFGGDAIACPSCGAEVYHDAAMCQDCGHLLTDAGGPRSGPARWVIVGVVGLMITALLLFTFGTPW